MTLPSIPAVTSLGESSSWTSVSEETVGSLHVRAVIGIDASAALVIRRELVDGRGHTHDHIVDLVLECEDPAQAEHRLRAVERYSGSPLLTAKTMRIIGPERFAEHTWTEPSPMTDAHFRRPQSKGCTCQPLQRRVHIILQAFLPELIRRSRARER